MPGLIAIRKPAPAFAIAMLAGATGGIAACTPEVDAVRAIPYDCQMRINDGRDGIVTKQRGGLPRDCQERIDNGSLRGGGDAS